MNTPLIQIKNVKKSFKKRRRQELLVLNDVNFNLHDNEIVVLLGKSGSGKSTLLRIIAGLVEPTAGEVLYHGEPIVEPVNGLTMVFQHFALLPWLTVLANVELGLEAQGVEREERRKRALEAIDTVGLDGFESAYPKELSGGMQQRVGIARALVVNPEVLLMDEPFSALDVLTADNLRNDLLDMWRTKKIGIKTILMVTHNIEEAAFLADRILMIATDPGFVKSEISVDLPHPRNAQDPHFRKLVDQIYTVMTQPEQPKAEFETRIKYKTIDMGYRLPEVDISELTGFVETLDSSEYGGTADLPEMAEALHLDVDDLFPITEALEILRFAYVSGGDIELTQSGRQFSRADILERKKLFATHLMKYVPLIRHIRETLDAVSEHSISEEQFLKVLGEHLSEQAAEEVLKRTIVWGRYAEIFAYDFHTGMLSLENPE
ncbi:MAG TPA: nitrate/sulfonate/bicarbonate ABC transporter ATP-binding protein [Coxiellaceae bacterium]|nr:nitrate/sulfonate/bicarbonate ABC transporter ATP-binding protein [Coxiellaceae bacterium]